MQSFASLPPTPSHELLGNLNLYLFFIYIYSCSLFFQMPVVWPKHKRSSNSRKSHSALWRNIVELTIPTNQQGLDDSFWDFHLFGLFHRLSSNNSSLSGLSEKLQSKLSFETCFSLALRAMPSSGHRWRLLPHCLLCHLQVILAFLQQWPCLTSTHQPLCLPTPCDSRP